MHPRPIIIVEAILVALVAGSVIAAASPHQSIQGDYRIAWENQ